MKRHIPLALAAAALASAPVIADEARRTTLVDYSADFDSVEVHLVNENGPGKYIGNIGVRDTEYGLVFEPALTSLPPGLHAFHVHEDPNCGINEKDQQHNQVPAGAAGDHFDPTGVDMHGGPWGVGHRGDLPNLFVNEKGEANHPVLAPRMKMEYLKARSLVIHENPDNYSNEPLNGGSGGRIACGVTSTAALEGRTRDQ